MIDEIHLHDVALIHDATLTPAAGLTVVTGESGSGKSALLLGIKLLVGERSDAGLVRDGADRLVVEGRFFYGANESERLSDKAASDMPRPDAGQAALSDAPAEPLSRADAAAASEDGLVVRRTVSAEGRSRVQVDGSMGTVRDLVNGPGAHVDLCGQHEHQRLLRAAEQALMLDAWIGSPAAQAREAYRSAFRAYHAAVAERDRIAELGRADAARVEEARFVLRTIDAVDPHEGEYEELLASAERAEHAEAIAQSLGQACEALSGEDGALDQVGRAAQALDGIAALDKRYDNLARAVHEASYVLEDAARDASSLRDDDDSFDAGALESLQERVASYQGLRRAYGPTMDEVFENRERAAEVVAAVDTHDEQVAAADKRVDGAEKALRQAGRAYHEQRSAAAPRFAEQVSGCLTELEMPDTELVCQVDLLETSEWSLAGPDKVEFLFRPGAGMGTRPLRRIASGGEISRVMLAVKVVLGQADGVDTLVFDEVDAGIGGKTARAVAVVLKRLARTHQVICVSHLPQIAVAGDRHFRVSKAPDEFDGRPETEIVELTGEDRIDEVARMLSGDTGEAARAHAAELLEEAQGFVE